MLLKVATTKQIRGEVIVPSSKSHSVRALLLAAAATGVSELKNVLVSDDTKAAIEVCRALGAIVTPGPENKVSGGFDVRVESAGAPFEKVAANIFTANSGITTRFVLPLIGLRKSADQPVVVDCGSQMKARPMAALLGALRELGLKIQDTNGTCPLTISGDLQSGNVTLDGTTSQYLSALLLSLPLVSENSTITVAGLNERPYVDMTLRWLDKLSIHYDRKELNGEDIFTVKGGQTYKSFTADIPGDFSTASYLIAGGVLIPGEITIKGLDFSDAQGDKRLVEILQSMGADIQKKDNALIVRGGKKIIGQTIDCNPIPDLVPTLAVIGAYAEGKTELANVPQARLKETDRLHSMYEGLSRLGAKVEEHADGLTVYQSALKGSEVKGYDDHRTIMALSLAGLIADGVTIIDTAEGINKTFPTFVETMLSLGANILKQ